MQRAGIEKHFRTGQQWSEKPHRQAEGVEQRQRRHKAIVGGKVGDGFNLFDVSQQAFVAVHDPLRVPFGAGGKEDNGRIFRLLFNLRQMRGQKVGKDPQLVTGGDLGFEIFQEHPAYLGQLFRQVPELAFIEERA
ncbi:hypothetical protein D3C78_1488140 [compost metagenome]